MKKYKTAFKRKIADLHINKNVSVAYLAEKYKVSRSSIYNWIKAEKLKNKNNVIIIVM